MSRREEPSGRAVLPERRRVLRAQRRGGRDDELPPRAARAERRGVFRQPGELGGKIPADQARRKEDPDLPRYAELDPQPFRDQAGLLIDGLAKRDGGTKPATLDLPGHNHTSEIAHLGSADEQFGRELLNFIRSVR